MNRKNETTMTVQRENWGRTTSMLKLLPWKTYLDSSSKIDIEKVIGAQCQWDLWPGGHHGTTADNDRDQRIWVFLWIFSSMNSAKGRHHMWQSWQVVYYLLEVEWEENQKSRSFQFCFSHWNCLKILLHHEIAMKFDKRWEMLLYGSSQYMSTAQKS